MSQGTDTPEQLKERIELTRSSFGGAKNTSITGVIVNKLNAPVDEQGRTRLTCPKFLTTPPKRKSSKLTRLSCRIPARCLFWVRCHGASI